jgi:hypothetical protein
MSLIDFEAAKEDESTSWKRAAPSTAMIERTSPVDYVVTLRGGDAHQTVFAQERGAPVGWCDCKGYRYSDDVSPCAHLCTLEVARRQDLDDVHGRPIDYGHSDALLEATARQVDPDLFELRPAECECSSSMTGELPCYRCWEEGFRTLNPFPPAGSDGYEFGRPEGKL